MKRQKKHTSGFLFSTPSLLTGAGTVINLAGNYFEFNISEADFEADKIAIENDFRVIGQDISSTLEILKNTIS
jgi:hypothetical protein